MTGCEYIGAQFARSRAVLNPQSRGKMLVSNRRCVSSQGPWWHPSWDSPIETSDRRFARIVGVMANVTQILSAIEQGDPQASEQLLPLVYEELQKLATY